jgi:hypothetical protein
MNWYIRNLRAVSIALAIVGVALSALALTWPFGWLLTSFFVLASAWHLLLAVRPQILTRRVRSE